MLILLNSSSWMVGSRKASQRDRRHLENTWAGTSDTGKQDATLGDRGLRIQACPRRDWAPSLESLHRSGSRQKVVVHYLPGKMETRTGAGSPQLQLKMCRPQAQVQSLTTPRLGRTAALYTTGCSPMARGPKHWVRSRVGLEDWFRLGLTTVLCFPSSEGTSPASRLLPASPHSSDSRSFPWLL